MSCSHLLKDLEKMIINELMNADNCTKFYHDALLVSIVHIHLLLL